MKIPKLLRPEGSLSHRRLGGGVGIGNDVAYRMMDYGFIGTMLSGVDDVEDYNALGVVMVLVMSLMLL